jgi:hypothetical protein
MTPILPDELTKEVILQKITKTETSQVDKRKADRKLKLESPTSQFSYSYLVDIQMAYSKVGLNAPVGLLCQISHNTDSELMVWDVYSLTVIPSYDCWRPPTNMLKNSTKESQCHN